MNDIRLQEVRRVKVFWEAQDVARRLELSSDSVRLFERSGALKAAARTPRGTRLFDPARVEKFAQARAERREQVKATPMASNRGSPR